MSPDGSGHASPRGSEPESAARASASPRTHQFVASLAAARTGGVSSIESLIEGYRNYLLLIANLAVKKGLQPRIGASDLVQETLFEAYKIFERFEGESEDDLLRWLTRILEFKIGNALKRFTGTASRDFRREIDWHELFGSNFLRELPGESQPSPGRRLQQDEARQLIQRELSLLPADQQQVVRLRVEENLTFEEIGQRLNRSADAARKLFARSLLKLQRQFASHQDL